MRIETSSTLSEEEIGKMCILELQCKSIENLKNKAYLSSEVNFDKEIPCFFRAYEGDRLRAFLTTFMPTPEEAEIIAYTDPNERNKGYFKKLLATAERALLEAGVKRVLFQIEPRGRSALKVLKDYKFNKWVSSEYTMSCSKCEGSNMLEHLSHNLSFQLLNEGNIIIYVNLIKEIFQEEEDYDNLVNGILTVEMPVAYVAFYENKPVGVFNLAYEGGHAYCYGVGIIREYRSRGFGKQLMKFALDVGFKHVKKIILHVDSSNIIAYKLYKKCGFGVDFEVQYYAYSLGSYDID